ncbi:hypothetical protein K492DRAFT_167245 [Lichtheimia hyalospora FSU 10163]|nr:hypothetical protein K492DRAFT_167245 [Lichtheimia hyalospora FSU 10163]
MSVNDEPKGPTPPTPKAIQPPAYPAPNDIRYTAVPPTLPLSEEQDNQQTTHVTHYPGGRASLSVPSRLALMTGVSSFWGFCLGSYLGGRQSGLQYLAENAHRLPTTVQGWYFYHKTKNYRMMLGGIKRGMLYGGRTGALCLMYGSVESTLDRIRGEDDILNSVAAGITSGVVFSAMTKLTRGSVRYAVKAGLLFGLVAGGLSDLHRTLAGNPPPYVKSIQSQVSS